MVQRATPEEYFRPKTYGGESGNPTPKSPSDNQDRFNQLVLVALVVLFLAFLAYLASRK